MRRSIVIATFLFGVLGAPSWAATSERSVADSPEEIRPLLIGADVPDVTLVTPDNRPVLLRDILSKKATILIYYRGGW